LTEVFESDSEYIRLLLIQTSVSQRLNPLTEENFVLQTTTVAEVVWMTEQFGVDEIFTLPFDMKREDKISKRAKKADNIVFEAVDETLKQIFRKEGTKVIYDFFENNYHLKRKEVVEKPDVFSVSLERLLGSAAPVVEKLILENLYCKLELKFREKEGYRFSDYIEELRKSVFAEEESE